MKVIPKTQFFPLLVLYQVCVRVERRVNHSIGDSQQKDPNKCAGLFKVDIFSSNRTYSRNDVAQKFVYLRNIFNF
jgi:hypothetical protein